MAPIEYEVISDTDTDVDSDTDDELELLGYDSDAPVPEIIHINDDDDNDDAANPQEPPKHLDIQLPDIEEDKHIFSNGVQIAPGMTVELKDRSPRPANQLHSADFLRVLHVIRDVETDEVRLRGLRLRRTKYHGQIFDWKLNELVLVLHVNENDARSHFIQGMVDVPTTEVLRVRDCTFTNKPYPLLSFRDPAVPVPIRARSVEEAKKWLFYHGRLVCRLVNILNVQASGKAYGGQVRHLYSHEVDASAKIPPSFLQEGTSREEPITFDEDGDVVIVNNATTASRNKRQPRSVSVEEFRYDRRRRPECPTKAVRYTFGDCFCGAGGASQGAKQAGLVVTWGLDHDEAAIEAYSNNHLGSLPFSADAHDFPPNGATIDELKVDILHLSPPCCYWSPAHTHAGRNDQANYEAIYTVGPILKKVEPRVATLEQTFGLATHRQHNKNFLLLLNDIIRAGYDLRYKIVDLSQYGLPQRRKRLLIIAAKRGTPLPPFPKTTHGDSGSGLARYVSVADALEPLERLGDRALNDKYHQPHNSKSVDKEPYDPHSSLLKGCITTGGGENHHYSGKRRYTVRECCLLQTFPYNYQFNGGQGEAMKQIGNAFPPVMAEALYRNIARTLEAFDHGLIGAEDDVEDIDAYLVDKGASSYRYLIRTESSSGTSKPKASISIFGRWTNIGPPQCRARNDRGALPYRNRERRQVLMEAELASEYGELIDLD